MPVMPSHGFAMAHTHGGGSMSHHLNFADRLASLGQHYLKLGRDQEALRLFGRLARLDEVAPGPAEAAQAGLADIYFRRRKFQQARRHLHVALARDPGCARYHHLLAITLEEDDVERAARHYARAVKLEPDVAEYHADYGLCLLSMAEVEKGITHLRRAVELAPDEPEFVRHLLRAFLDAERSEEARRAVLAALFRSPRDHRFQSLWQEFRFWEAQRTQRRAEVQRKFRMDRPVLLPFKAKRRKNSQRSLAEDGMILRIDSPQASPRPHCPEPARRRQRP
jgi:tetratricopeptide (TPR) repeat protein